MIPATLLLAATAMSTLVAPGGAARLYVASKDVVTVLSLTGASGNPSLKEEYTKNDCGKAPTWLTLDGPSRLLYCFDENVEGNGTISAYKAPRDGQLERVSQLPTPSGPVSGAVYGDKSNAAVAVANYGSQSVSTFGASDAGTLKAFQTFAFTMAQPGPVKDRQDKPHPHQAIVDPSGRFLVVPDLGADLVRYYSFEKGVDKLTEHAPLCVQPGSGPRHAVFWSAGGQRGNGAVFMYVLGELANSITGYRVAYPPNGGMVFRKVSIASSLVGGTPKTPSSAAEIMLSPDNKFITVSNRGDQSVKTPSGPSDSLVTFRPMPDGCLQWVQIAAAGGTAPRHFSFNKDGTLVAVGLMGNNTVSILARNPFSGTIGGVLATAKTGVEPACVIWDD